MGCGFSAEEPRGGSHHGSMSRATQSEGGVSSFMPSQIPVIIVTPPSIGPKDRRRPLANDSQTADEASILNDHHAGPGLCDDLGPIGSGDDHSPAAECASLPGQTDTTTYDEDAPSSPPLAPISTDLPTDAPEPDVASKTEIDVRTDSCSPTSLVEADGATALPGFHRAGFLPLTLTSTDPDTYPTASPLSRNGGGAPLHPTKANGRAASLGGAKYVLTSTTQQAAGDDSPSSDLSDSIRAAPSHSSPFAPTTSTSAPSSSQQTPCDSPPGSVAVAVAPSSRDQPPSTIEV